MSAPRAFLSSLEQIGIKLGLDQIRGLVAALDFPDRHYPALIVAGTNGKGSVTAMIERGLRAAGLRTGRYTSPHLTRLEERFAIDGDDIHAEALDDALARVQHAARTLPAPPSYFEATTAAALDLFRSSGVDVAVLEVGLGGRLDATNVVNACASVITAVAFDHQQFLGDTLEAIAREKAGVIKPRTFCVLADNPPQVQTVVAARCDEIGTTLVRADDGTTTAVSMREGRATITVETPVRRYPALRLGLRGRHQVANAIAAMRTLELLDSRRLFRVSGTAIQTAVEHVIWPARLELVEVAGHPVLIDGAHNAAGAAALAAFVLDTYGRPLPFVLGVVRDKDVDAIVSAIAPAASPVFCTAASSARAMPPLELATVVSQITQQSAVEAIDDPLAAIAAAARHGGPVVVAGSLYLAGDVRPHIS